MRLGARVFIILVMVLLIFGMGVHYDTAHDRHWPYPDGDDLATGYGAHIGQTTLLWGTVVGVDAGSSSAVIKIQHESGTMTLDVQELEVEVEPGGVVQVLGTIQPGHEVSAERVVVVNRRGAAEWFKFVISGIGALVMLIVFFRHWRIDWDVLAFKVR